MGVDACIYFEKTGEAEFERPLPQGFSVAEITDDYIKEANPGATHEIDTLSRYYSDSYPRGDWTKLCAVLMLLIECPGVGRVWYGGDHMETLPECTVEDVLSLSRHFMESGNGEYGRRGDDS